MDRTRRAVRRPPGFADASTQQDPSLDRPSSSSPVTSHSSFKSRKSTPPLFTRAAIFHKPGAMDPRPRFGRSASFKQGGLAATPAKDGNGSGVGSQGIQGIDSPEKGGHSLRKRTRVNYATEQIEDEVVVPNSSSTARGRKRRLDVGFDDIDTLYGPRAKSRGVSLGADTPSARRRNPSRKTSEIAPFRPFDEERYGHDDDDDDDDIQDTIEVGLSPSDITDDDEDDDEDIVDDDGDDNDEHKEPVIPGEFTKAPIDSASTPVPVPQLKAQEEVVASPSTLAAEHAGKEETPALSPKATNVAEGPKVEPIDLGSTKDDVPVGETTYKMDEPRTTSDEQYAPTTNELVGTATESANGEVETSTDAKPQAQSTELIAQDVITTGDVVEAPRSPSPPTPPPPPPPPPPPTLTLLPPPPPPPADEPLFERPEESLRTADPDTVPPEATIIANRETLIEERSHLPKWAHLRAWVGDEWSIYPEKLTRSDEDDAASEAQSVEDKDVSKDASETLVPADESTEAPAVTVTEIPTSAQNTPTRGSPAQEIPDIAGPTSPAFAGEEPEEAESSEPQETQEKTRQYRYRTLPDPETFVRELDNYADMNSADLFNMLLVVNEAMVDWERQYYGCNKIIDDYENSDRRRAADAKYETRTRNLNQHGVNYEESDLVLKGYKAKEKDGSAETRYLQAQDRIMASAYGFEYDPHPSKIGRQNPANQQAGMTTRGRSLRNQPRQTAKATELDVGVTGKRQRKPVQLYDPAPQEESRHSTPVPTRKRRRNANAEGNDEGQINYITSFQTEASPDIEAPPSAGRRKRARKAAASRIAEESGTPAFASSSQDPTAQDEQGKTVGRRGRPKGSTKTEDVDNVRPSIENEPQHSEPAPTRMLTLKIPKGTHFSGPSSAITDNGESRPSTANSDSTAHTVESSYSFRPKRQKRFRDAPSDTEDTPEDPPKKKKRTINIVKKRTSPDDLASVEPDHGGHSNAKPIQNGPEAPTRKAKGKANKPKDIESRNGTPISQQTDGGDEPPKDYSTMTKSEKMSASMRNRWKNGNMQKAVEKRKATLAAKKAAQVAAERNGVLASRADTGPSQTVQAPALPVENTPFAHGYHSAVLQHAEQPHMPQQMPRQQQQQQQLPPPPPPPQPHPLGFGAGYPYQH